jgi:hypothetical protein
MAHLLVTLFARIAVPLFFLGMAGSALVVLDTLLGDLQQITKSDPPAPMPVIDAGQTHP